MDNILIFGRGEYCRVKLETVKKSIILLGF